MNHADDKITGVAAKGKPGPQERRKFLRNFLGIGILAGFFLPGQARPGPSSPPPSVRADFWRKGGRLAG